jgi:hypothetical protein
VCSSPQVGRRSVLVELTFSPPSLLPSFFAVLSSLWQERLSGSAIKSSCLQSPTPYLRLDWVWKGIPPSSKLSVQPLSCSSLRRVHPPRPHPPHHAQKQHNLPSRYKVPLSSHPPLSFKPRSSPRTTIRLQGRQQSRPPHQPSGTLRTTP